MKSPVYTVILSILFLIPASWSCKREAQWEGQEAVKKVSTETVPIQLQYKGCFDLGTGIYMSNEFEGARLNGAARTNDTLITALITPENSPINMSPWYAFKLWSDYPRDIYIKLSYPEDAGHRYHPKVSPDGKNWLALDTASFQVTMKSLADEQVKKGLTMKLSVGPDTMWISAQELITSDHVDQWMRGLESKSYVQRDTIGLSHEGRPVSLLRIGESDDQRMIMVISRQHPPEVPGFLAMQAFVETLCADTELARAFRSKYNTYVVPVANPDGVYHGHWRHNRGGVDLNRDWEEFKQPETSAIRNFMKLLTNSAGGKFYFGVDFHSTFEDIYYTIDPELEGNMPGLVPQLIEATAQEFPDYTPNIKPNLAKDARITSTSFLFFEFGAEALTYEIGDHTPRDFIHKKGEVSAMKLMELMLK
jgi:cytosolic carboxypeptidase protein 6